MKKNEQPFFDYFLGKEPKPTLEEVQNFFPSVCVSSISGSYELRTKENSCKDVSLNFWKSKEITILLSIGNDIHWRRKTISSFKEFISLKDTLLNFLFCDTRKVQTVYTWENGFKQP